MRIITVTVGMIMTASFAAWADDPPAKAMIPLSTPYKNVSGNSPSQSSAALPHFFPLRVNATGKFIQHSNAAPQKEEIPVAHEIPPGKMTQEQAIPIAFHFSAAA